MKRRRCFSGIAALNTPAVRADSEKQLLSPTGHTRVGVYGGSPTSMVSDTRGESRGVGYDLGPCRTLTRS